MSVERATDVLRTTTFDLLVVGGGVYGAAVAREASLSGLSVALIERDDFAGGTSSNSLKILHGGLRYLQQLNLSRMRDSIRARREWARLAPELVKPLPCAIATEGVGLRSMFALGAALLANDLVSADRNSGLDHERRLPRGRLLPRDEYDRLIAKLADPAGRRGALWWDAIALDTERLVLELLSQAAGHGAVVANYTAANHLLLSGSAVHGVAATDGETGLEFEIMARRVLCACGNAAEGLVGSLGSQTGMRPRAWCSAVNVILRREMAGECAVALTARVPAVAGGLTSKGSRELFFVPWRARTMVGTHYAAPMAASDEPHARRNVITEFMEQIREAAPRLAPEIADICFVHWGTLPLVRDWQPGDPLKLDSSVEIIDIGAIGGATGLWQVQGPKFTTAIEVARRVVPRMAAGLSMASKPASGQKRVRQDPDFTHSMQGLEAQAEKAAKDRWARRLDDVVFRRTGCGSAGYPGRQALEACAKGMGRAHAWSEARMAAEVSAVQDQFRRKHFWSGNEHG